MLYSFFVLHLLHCYTCEIISAFLRGNTEDGCALAEGKGQVGQWLFGTAAFFLVFSSLSHFLEPVLWPLKLGAQVNQLTKVCLLGKERTYISITSTFS